MKPWWMRYVLRNAAGEGEGGGGAAPAPAPAAPAAAPAAPAPSPAAPSPAPAAPAPTPAAAPKADDKGYWPENWRETVSKDDAKVLARLQRYGSPEAAMQALIAAQNRIASGELKPVLGKNASADELKEWRAAHGIPETPDKYDLGKLKIAEHDKPFFDLMFKSAHASHQNNEQVQGTVRTWYAVREKLQEAHQKQDETFKQEAEDKLRAEWGNDFRRNNNLIQGLLDLTGSQELAADLMEARLSDGRRIKDSPEAQKMLLSLALINNPTGVVVPGGSGATGEGIREALEKLQKIPANKKTPKQDEEQRGLINAAIKSNLMDERGNWK